MTALRTSPVRSAQRAWIRALLCIAFGLVPTVAGAATPIHLSLFHPISTSSDVAVETNFALSLVQSRIGSLHGLGFHGIVSEVGSNMGGLQFTGVYSRVGKDARGLVVSGLASSVGGDMRGIQTAGLVNFNDGSVRGLQVSGLLNFNRGGAKGIQVAGILNTNSGASGFLQVAGVANTSHGPVRGLQVAGFMNVAEADLAGAQISIGNLATEFRGAQVGVFNRARFARGLQLGVVNRSEENTGLAFGPVNISKKSGRTEAVLFTSSFSATNIGIRTEVNRFSSMLTVGATDLEGDVLTAGFLTWTYGYRIPLTKKFSVLADAGMTHVMPRVSDDPLDNDKLHYGLMARGLLDFRASDRVSIFGGPGALQIYSDYGDHPSHESDILVTLGLSVKP